LLLGFLQIVSTELFGINLLDIICNRLDHLGVREFKIVKQMEEKILICNIILHNKGVFCPLFDNFLRCDVIDDRKSIQPFYLSVNFNKCVFPVGCNRELILVILVFFLLLVDV